MPVLESERAVEKNAFNPWNLEIASDELTGADAAERRTRATGRRFVFERLATEQAWPA